VPAASGPPAESVEEPAIAALAVPPAGESAADDGKPDEDKHAGRLPDAAATDRPVVGRAASRRVGRSARSIELHRWGCHHPSVSPARASGA